MPALVADRRRAGADLRPLGPERERLDPGQQLGLVERPGDDVVGARLEQGDPLVEAAALGDREDRDLDVGEAARSMAIASATVVGSVSRSIMIRL